jgi:RecA/RadA recombinase
MAAESIWIVSAPVPVRQRPPKPERIHSADTPELAVLRSALDAIPNDTDPLDYDRWWAVIAAIHHATEGSDDGLALAHEFSARSGKYDADFLDNRIWSYLGVSSAEPITVNSLYAVAEAHGWQDPTIADDFENIEEQDMAEARQAIANIMDELAVVGAATALAKIKERLPAAKLSEDEHRELQERAAAAGGLDQEQARKLLPTPRPRFASTPFDEILKSKSMSWLIKGVLPYAEVGMLFGESGAGKSFVVLDMAAAVVRGVSWRGRKVKQGKVAYVAAEGAAGFRQRVQAYAHHHGPEAAEALRAGLRIHETAPNLLTKNDATELAKQINAEGGVDLIIVDTLAQTTPGAEENGSKDMGWANDQCKRIHALTGAMVLVIHHAGKDLTKGARGWSGLKGAQSVELSVERLDASRVLTVTKLKDGREGDQFPFKLLTVPLGMDEDGEVIDSCVVEHSDEPVVRDKKAKGKVQRMVLDAVRDMYDLDGSPPEQSSVEDKVLELAIAEDDGPERWDAKRRHNKLGAIRTAIDSMVAKEMLIRDDGRLGLWSV